MAEQPLTPHVLAGSWRQASEWARERGMFSRDIVYVTEAYQVWGKTLVPEQVHLVGDWYNHPRSAELHTAVMHRLDASVLV